MDLQNCTLAAVRRSVDAFKVYLAPTVAAQIVEEKPYDLRRDWPAIQIPRAEAPGLYVFLAAADSDLDGAPLAYVGKTEAGGGLGNEVSVRYREYQSPANADYPVTHLVVFTLPRELGFLAPALESFLLRECRTRDNSRLHRRN